MFEIIKTDHEPGWILAYTGKKILSENQAWEVTFKKWERLQKVCRDGKLAADGGVKTCGLCALYYYGHSDECESCPIKEAGYPGCSRTPYAAYQEAVKSGNLMKAMLAAERELPFLRIIHRQNQAKPPTANNQTTTR